MSCPFCIPNQPILARDDNKKVWAIEESPGHIMLVPMEHVPPSRAALQEWGAKLLSLLEKLPYDCFELVAHINYHISIPHLHIHLWVK